MMKSWIAISALVLAPWVMAERAGNVVLGKYEWKNLKGKVINVCWEKAGYEAEKLIVQNAVKIQWEDFIDLKIEFRGICDLSQIFSPLAFGEQWVGIKVEDTYPHTRGMGNLLNMNYDGSRPADPFYVRLNFIMTQWPGDAFGWSSKTSQQKSLLRDALIRMQAVHEFGHVIGLGHEHARRREVPRECRTWVQGEVGVAGTQIIEEQSLTLDHIYYDEYSIMNYCTILGESNYPQSTVSCGDVATARYLYGDNGKGYAPCCTPARIEEMVTGSDYRGTGINQWIANSKCGDRSSSSRVSPGPGGSPNQFTVSSRTHPAIEVEPPVRDPSSAPDPDFQWEIIPQTQNIKGIDYTGYAFRFTALGSAYPSENSVALLYIISLLLPGETTPREGLISAQRGTESLFHKNGTMTNLYWQATQIPLADLPADKWVAKGFGAYSQASGNWFQPIPAPSANGTWKYTPEGGYLGHAHFDKGIFFMWGNFGRGLLGQVHYQKHVLITMPMEIPALVPYPILKTGFPQYGKMIHLWRQGNTPNLWWDKSEVTQLGYQEVMGLSPFNFLSGPEHPAENVTWYDAILYCIRRSQLEGLQPVYAVDNPTYNSTGNCTGFSNFRHDFSKSGYRLPTHEEWMTAYKPQSTGYYWEANPENHAWYSANSGNGTHPGAQKIANNRGLHDMAGNVQEWVHAAAESNYANAVGGDYDSGVDKLSYSHYYQYGKGNRYPWIGFRAVRKGRPNILPSLNLLLE